MSITTERDVTEFQFGETRTGNRHIIYSRYIMHKALYLLSRVSSASRFIIYPRLSDEVIIYLQRRDVSIFESMSAESKVPLYGRDKDVRDADDGGSDVSGLYM